MPDDQPEQQAPPADPFRAGHTGNVMVLEVFRGLREAGGSLVDSAFITAAFVIANGRADQQ